MVFSSNIFLFLFLPLTLFLYFALPEKIVGKKYKNYLLLAASLLFYSWGEAYYLWLLMLSILGNYAFGIWIEKCQAPKVPGTFGAWHQRCLALFPLFLAITFNLALLLYFKYANFIVENLNHILPFKIELAHLHLPIGISFFTFHAISYLVDIYRRKCRAQRSFSELTLYIAFFPQLIAGPIVRYNFIEKYLHSRRHSWFFAAHGARRFIIGLGKKVIIANPLGELADVIFALPATELSTPIAWVGIVCYTLQIYFDFSGYSDMAIGLARIFGFKFPENFNYPYISRSIKEFWRRWHMSLSAWFRDYVYIPLGGNRVSTSRQYFNLVLVFFLCGLWHGASWNFIIWGAFHGLFLVVERLMERCQTPAELSTEHTGIGSFAFLRMTGWAYTILVVMIGWVFFRSPDLAHALNYLQTMFGAVFMAAENLDVARLMRSHFVWMSFGLALLGFSPLVKNLAVKMTRRSKVFFVASDIFLIAVLVLAIVRISAATHNPFIYFQF